MSCDAYLDGTKAMGWMPEIEIQKNYGRWGQVACSGGYVCEDSGLCCIRCVDLDNGDQFLRCHDLTPDVVERTKDALGF